MQSNNIWKEHGYSGKQECRKKKIGAAFGGSLIKTKIYCS
jgi:hypothetical protein